MKVEITSRLDSSVLFSVETTSMKLAVEAAIKSRAGLQHANLQYADLQSANLQSADLRSADLRSANLQYADLQSANLQSANLQSANLRSANLRSANLRSANLRSIRDDLWAVLSSAPAEVRGLRAALAEGRIDGSTYEGDCSCLVGTLARVRGCNYNEIPTLTPDSGRPSEVFFMTINKGDTHETSSNAKVALEWIDTWLANMQSAFGVRG